MRLMALSSPPSGGQSLPKRSRNWPSWREIGRASEKVQGGYCSGGQCVAGCDAATKSTAGNGGDSRNFDGRTYGLDGRTRSGEQELGGETRWYWRLPGKGFFFDSWGSRFIGQPVPDPGNWPQSEKPKSNKFEAQVAQHA